jgi:2-polyprenyl-3-methyl-5-hydroxy-6-metoxy-1,4-benzoquinol methylase
VKGPRVQDAPRLIEWTGERCVPWAPDPPVIYEHFHRYLFASRLVDGSDVLDLASGEGFGAALLAEAARSVVGIDVDERTVEHSRLNYVVDNLQFEVGDARDLSRFEPGSFGAVVAFELIEHMAEHDQLLGAIDRVLAADGMLIISSPNKQAYTNERDFENPFHVRELTLEELLALLKGRFTNVSAWAQRTVGGSLLSPLAAPGSNELQGFRIERSDGDWRLVDDISPMYVVAIASNGKLPSMPAESLLVDAGDELVKAGDQALASERAAREFESVKRELLSVGDALWSERRLTAALQQRAAGDEHIIARLQTDLANIQTSSSWRLFLRMRRLLYGILGGRDSPMGKLLNKVLRALGRLSR